MNKPIRRVAVACLLMFAILLVNDNLVQFAKAKTLRDKPGNTRLLYQQYDRKRGDIVTATGLTIASSVPTNDTLKYLRSYPKGPLYAPVTGFYSIVYGGTQVESTENSILAGTDDRLFGVQQLSNLITGRTPQGGSVVLTIDPVLQQVASTALAGRKGAVVALDPTTGAILALVSSPSYDPNVLSSHTNASITAYYKQLLADPTTPLLDRALNQTYPPGSTFKLITAAAALSTGTYTPTTVIPAPETLPLPQSTAILKNFHGESCGGQAALIQALTISCNTAFGALGLTLGQDALRSQADAFGFDSTFSVPMKSATSVFPIDLSDANTIQSAIGQYDVRATPLQMAQVAAAIANGGMMMKPYLVSELVGPDLKIIDQTKPTELRRSVSTQVATDLTQMMESVVQKGTGTSARIPGVQVAGKTGTAENAPGAPPHAWFVAFAPATKPTIAIAVLVENGGGNSDATGGAISAPIAKAVISAALKRQP
jgi:peptidoglycan glycosyltransferase